MHIKTDLACHLCGENLMKHQLKLGDFKIRGRVINDKVRFMDATAIITKKETND